MRKLGFTLITLSVLIIVGITGYLMVAIGSGQAPPSSDAEFMAQVLERTSAESGGAVKTAVLPPSGSGQGLPVLRVATEHYNMGLIKNDGFSFQKMKVYNDGDAPLIVSNVKTSCACTTGKMENSEIPPGGEGNLVIRLDPYRIPGFRSTKVLTLSSNDPTNSRQQVKVSAQVDPEIGLEVEQLDFKGLTQGKGAEQSFKIRQLQDQPFKILEAKAISLPNIFSTRVVPLPEEEWLVPGRQEYLMTVMVSPDAPPGNHSERFRLQFDLKRLRYMVFRATAEVQGAYALNPRTLNLKSELGANLKSVLTLSSGEGVELLSVKSNNEFINVSHRAGDEPSSIVFDVDLAKDGTEKRLQTDEWELTFKVKGEVVTEKIPVVVLLDFAEASLGESAS